MNYSYLWDLSAAPFSGWRQDGAIRHFMH